MKFKFAIDGILHALKQEQHMKFHVLAGILVCLVGWFLRITQMEWIGILFAIGFVVVAELINSSIEALCDTLHPGQDERIGRVKDMAAGAVLVAAVIAMIVGCIVFIPHIMELLH